MQTYLNSNLKRKYVSLPSVFKKKFILQDISFLILYSFLPYINMNQPRVYICPFPPEPPPTSHPSPPLWSPPSTGLSSPCHTANSHWAFILHMVVYIFPCSSLNSSNPLLLPSGPQDCSLCLCLHRCPELISTIFLDSTHIR